ncbi:DUF928 domain-containing protein [Pantanalinema rosaneae CENA516]|uniref:DUF928 domain-containing protein n=1 Tax=Pantanalinema rosaneae TaxID=1620701 RepID=UPI003D6F19E4
MNDSTFKTFGQRVLTSLLTGLVAAGLLVSTAAQADEDKAPPSGRSAGGRGCSTASQPLPTEVPALILLTPNQHPGQTASTRPTFAWFVRDAAAVPLEFRLYERQNDGFKLVEEIKGDRLKSSPGIMVLSLEDVPIELAVGKRYRWQVELVCNPGRPSGNLFAESEFEVISLKPALKTQLDHAQDPLAQANLFAQADLWYDALETILDPMSQQTQLQRLRLALLDRVATNTVEQQLLHNSEIHPVQK